jgi:hypothetical protein
VSHKILDKLAKDLSALNTVVEPLSEADLDKQHGDGWTIREILTHLWNAEEDHCRVIATIAKGEHEKLAGDLNLDEHNSIRLNQRGSLSKADILAGLAAQRARTEGLFNRLSEEDLGLEGRHPALGQITIEKIFRVIGIHMKMHLQEIHEALK